MDGRTKGSVIRAALIGLTTLAATTTADAQRSTGRRPVVAPSRTRTTTQDRMTGFMLGVHTIGAPGLTVSSEDLGELRTGFGPGAGVMLGYGFNRTFSGFVSLDVAKQNSNSEDYQGSLGLSHFEVGGRANISTANPATVPYVSASIGRRTLGTRFTDPFVGAQHDLTLSGGMFGLGGGIQHVFSPTMAIDGGLELGFGRFGHVELDGESANLDVDGSTSVRLRIGVNWWPGSR